MTRGGRIIRGGTGFMLGLMAGAAFAQTPSVPSLPSAPPLPAAPGKPSAKVKPSVPAPDPAYETARIAFEALPEPERKGLQDALVWTGDYNSVINGAFGRRSYEALQAYARRSGGTGLPDAAGRAALLKEGAAARAAARFTVKPDPASGVVLGVPERLLPKRLPQPGGTRWQSADGRITLETKSEPPGETGLEAVFARITAPGPERRVTYKILRPDFLVVTAETGTGKSYIRYAAGEAGLRGIALGYDKALAGEVDRLAIAIANSFVPFPPASPGPAPLPAQTRKSVPVATGLVVAPGRVLTSAAALGSCRAPAVGGAPARVAKGAGGELVMLETGPLTGHAPVLPAIRATALTAGEAVLVLGADAEGGVAVAPGEAEDGPQRIGAPLQPGAGGAPVLDRSGALVGLVASFPASPRLVAGIVPPARYGLVPAGIVAAVLETAGLEEAGLKARALPKGAGTLSAAAATLSGAVVAITCQP
ncbi:serine protease [Methylobacterium sp. J-068]|uniref:serine protease n=1 Tax=Methylobacterium sp. J-068 TaxID=2836649 RepID=UPI001FBB7207|nr:serine protease [Methylobacterium sp. J-068]MCJ2034094.1 serine protease [Methylobacterium sp. J-068]